MARNVLIDTDYVFNPNTYTITIPDRYISQERIMLITDVTNNSILYNFSDSTKPLASVTKFDSGVVAGTGANNILGTTITLTAASFTSGLTYLSTDKIQIYYDDVAQVTVPDEVLLDGAQKQRVSQPQSLMDTDFEYSVQPSKWEAAFLTSNYPSYFPKPNGGNAIPATSIYGDGSSPRSLITVTSSLPHGLTAGTVVNVQETLNYRVEGTFGVTSAPTIYTFTYRARGVVVGEQIFQNLTTVYGGDVYDSSHIPGGNYPGLGALSTQYGYNATNTLNTWIATTDGASPSTITVTFVNQATGTPQPHGLFPGATIAVAGTNSFDGDYIINAVPNMSTIKFTTYSTYPSITVGSAGRIITKSDGYIIHRPYDAGVSLTTYNNVPGLRTIRQTRRYFRYQAGKAIQFSTGAKLTPTFNVESISASTGVSGQTAVVTINTVEDHGMQGAIVNGIPSSQPGATIKLEGIVTSGSSGYNPYNGTFTVQTVTNSNQFTINIPLTQNLATTDLTPQSQSAYAHCSQWYGAEVRAGMFDDQNGFYFSFDGNTLAVNRRHSDKLLSGRINVTQNSALVTGVGTAFRKQLVVGGFIVIKGSSYQVTAISSDTQLYIAPAYKGLTSTGQRATVTQGMRVTQSQWNMDKCDGTGPSGYTIDMTKMQMIYIDYSWYGAGTIRFGVRGPRGNVIYVHRIVNSNVNQLAYQKSGNLPARYEVDNSPITYSRMTAGAAGTLGSVLNPNDLIMYVDNVTQWPSSGQVVVKDDLNIEIVNYSGIGAYVANVGYPITLTARRASNTLIYPDQGFTYTANTNNSIIFTADSSFSGTGGNAQVSVQPLHQNCAPIVQHWGSSVVMDGQFQTDLLPIFTAGMTKYQTIAAGTSRPLLALRIAPSVDNAIARNYGYRELINRMALQLQSVGIQTNGSYRIDCILNPSYLGYTQWTAAQLAVTRSSVTGTSGTNYITVNDTGTINVAGTAGLGVGQLVSGAGISAGTYITNIWGNTVQLSSALTTGATGTYTFTPTSGFTGLPNDWGRDSVGNASLAQAIFIDNGFGQGTIQTASGNIQGGDSIFSFFSENGGGASNYNSSVYSLTGLKDVGNSMMSGNGNPSTPGFPGGPDVVVIVATNIGTAASQISARLSWTEAQA